VCICQAAFSSIIINYCRYYRNRFHLKLHYKFTWHWLISSVHTGTIVQRSIFAIVYVIGFYASNRFENVQRMTAYTLFGRVVIRKEACSLYHQCLAIFILIEQRQILHEMNIINRSSHEHSVRCYYVEKAFVELSDKRK